MLFTRFLELALITLAQTCFQLGMAAWAIASIAWLLLLPYLLSDPDSRLSPIVRLLFLIAEIGTILILSSALANFAIWLIV